jgi:energy-coupling factor transporter transmembrane protein EcfT
LPFIYEETKKGLWTLRFRGFNLMALTTKEKFIVIKKLLKLILLRGIHYVAYSSLALELRGYGATGFQKIPAFYPFKKSDYLLIALILMINIIGLYFMFN